MLSLDNTLLELNLADSFQELTLCGRHRCGHLTGSIRLELALPPAAGSQRLGPIRISVGYNVLAVIVRSSLALDLEACGKVQRLHLVFRTPKAASFQSIICFGILSGRERLEG